MFTKAQIDVILASPGSYNHWCVLGPHGDPFWSHTRIGHVLKTVTPAEREAQRVRAMRF